MGCPALPLSIYMHVRVEIASNAFTANCWYKNKKRKIQSSYTAVRLARKEKT